jgi:hypothetical protein
MSASEVTMRRVVVIALCAVSFLITLPAPAHAWWDWLEEYSGPGPFTGFDFQWRLACINDPLPEQMVREELTAALAAARGRVIDALLTREREGRALTAEQLKTLQDSVENAEKELANLPALVELRRKRIDPGPGVLRSLASYESSHQNWAGFFGAGCVSQENHNPLGSLNFRLAYLWSIHNRLTYAEPEFAEDGPRVTLLQPELSFTVFVDQRKSVELGSAMGVSFAFTDKKGVSPFARFYWRPLILTVSPVSLLRLKTPKGWRALTITSSIVIMPQDLNDVDFGAVPGTFHSAREMQGLFGLTLDLSRF